MNATQLWSKAAELQHANEELLRKAQCQAGCMANEGHSSEEIDCATAVKMAQIRANRSAIEVAMKEWSVAA